MRRERLPYGRHAVDDEDIAAVSAVLRAGPITTGPEVEAFEADFARFTAAPHAVALANGTAALHASCAALGLGPGDEVAVPAITFAATANAALFVGARPRAVDVRPDTLLIDVDDLERRLTPRTRAVIAVDFAGQPAPYEALRPLCRERGLHLVADACHALGGALGGQAVGGLATLNTFSFHAVKPITTGEGGMVTTADPALADRMRQFRNHCLSVDASTRAASATWRYAIDEMGMNYRLTAFQSALGRAQLRKLPAWVERRTALAAAYDAALADVSGYVPLARLPERSHAWHLYVVRLPPERWTVDRDIVFAALSAEGIGVNVHYWPWHLQPHFQRVAAEAPACPVAESAARTILTLPLFPAMTPADHADAIRALRKVFHHYGR